MRRHRPPPAGLAYERRDILRLLSLGGITFASALAGCGARAIEPRAHGAEQLATKGDPDFFFLQLSDTHWGYHGAANPDSALVLPDVVARINASPEKPDFVLFTGDLTHSTEDASERRDRMKEFRDIVSKLDVKEVRFLPGEHDAAGDRGDAYQEIFGDRHYSFDRGGVHFIALDNVSAPNLSLGDDQLAWLESDLAKIAPAAPIVVFAHRPLFDLYPAWDWRTMDGDRALELLGRRSHVTVFFGHIHQELHRTIPTTNGGSIAHHSARSLVFPLPAPGSVADKKPPPWDGAAADHGLGYRSIVEQNGTPKITELPLVASQRS
jgi:3',5'-cyclic AMP phosphodiesterase CpdA